MQSQYSFISYCFILSQSFTNMERYKAKFKDEAGFYTCTWYFDELEDFWAAVAREERVYKSKFQQLIID